MIMYTLVQALHTSNLNFEHTALTRKESKPNTAAMIVMTTVCAHHKIWHIAQCKTTHAGNIPAHCKTGTNTIWQLHMTWIHTCTISCTNDQYWQGQCMQLRKQHNHKHKSFTLMHNKQEWEHHPATNKGTTQQGTVWAHHAYRNILFPKTQLWSTN